MLCTMRNQTVAGCSKKRDAPAPAAVRERARRPLVSARLSGGGTGLGIAICVIETASLAWNAAAMVKNLRPVLAGHLARRFAKSWP